MYPERELIRLSVYKAALRRDIAVRRMRCAAAASRVVRPLVAVDRVVTVARRLPALAGWVAIAAAVLATGAAGWRTKPLRPILRWAPMVLGAWRGARGLFALFR